MLRGSYVVGLVAKVLAVQSDGLYVRYERGSLRHTHSSSDLASCTLSSCRFPLGRIWAGSWVAVRPDPSWSPESGRHGC